MKKIVTILLLFVSFHFAFSQDTLYHPSRYLHIYEDTLARRVNDWVQHCPHFYGTEYTVDTPTVIYGVAVTCSLSKDIAIWGMLVEKDKDSADCYHVVDSSAKNLYREPDKYYAFPLSDSCDGSTPITYAFRPVYEFFYPTPHLFYKADTFYVGFKAFNKECGENYNWNHPIVYLNNHYILPSCNSDIYTLFYTPPVWSRLLHCNFYFYPILMPPDTTQHGATCDADLACDAEVEGFRLYNYYQHQPIFQWRTEPGQSYQLGYAPFDTDSAAFRIVGPCEPLFRLLDEDLDSNVMYVARIRTSCRHQCAVHDTVTWGPWSEPVFFHTGQHVPDTNRQGLCQIPAPQRFALTPNPAYDRVELTVPDLAGGSYLVSLLSQDGRNLSTFRTSEPTITLAVDHLPAGLYLVTVKTASWSSTQRLVVE